MRPSISPQEKALFFSFRDTDCLYRDHFGNRVLADVEGRGTFRIDPPIETLSVTVDDIPANRFEGSYDHSLLVTSPQPGSYQINVAEGRTELLRGSVLEGEKFEGCGWIVGAEQISDLDSERADCGLRIVDWEMTKHQRLEPSKSSNPSAAPPQSTIPDPQSPPPPKIKIQNSKLKNPPFPLPFFQHVSGTGLQVVLAAECSTLVDAFDLSDETACRERGWRVQNVSKLFELDGRFPDGTKNKAPVLSHLNAASWRVPIPPGCKGLIVRKLYDAFHGRQRARVLVDGAFAGWWYEPVQDRTSRWRWARFGIEAPFLGDKSEVTVTIDPPAGSPLWSVSRIETLGLRIVD